MAALPINRISNQFWKYWNSILPMTSEMSALVPGGRNERTRMVLEMT